jgi:N-alpha-acetyl-L-2,4-diaminobutyrate deacetylase
MRQNPITPTIDLEAEGVQHGHLKLPHSSDDSAWGAIMIPITVVRSGAGPTALLTGGNHGDEYEGPVALFDLTNKLRPEEVTGRVIIVPAMNYPAFLAARRTSPIDGGNMNRVFPGRPDGGVTEKIADYFQRARHWISFPSPLPTCCPTRRSRRPAWRRATPSTPPTPAC